MRPTDDQLRQFLLGILPVREQETVAKWVETAPDAAEHLARVEGEPPAHPGPADPFVAALGRAKAPPVPPAVSATTPRGFRIERELGVGGMGVVYLGHQAGLNRPVAIKLVKDGEQVDAKALIRFLAEAEAVAAVKHPNVVEVFQYGEHNGRPYLALEYCPGGDLTSFTRSDPGASAATIARDAGWFRRVADLMAKVADGVNAAHELGIVHRDLKPHNVLMSADGTPKVADFGLAKRGLGKDLTHTQAVMGTPAYMSPEQAKGETKFVGPEADVWSLGVMLYELACGERPFDAPTPIELVAKVANATVPPLRSKCPGVPADLSLIVHKCLAADARDRYRNAGELANDLRNWLDGKPISARTSGMFEQAVKWAKRKPKQAAGVAGVLLVLVGLVVALGWAVVERGSRLATEQDRLRDSRQATARLAEARSNPRELLAALDTLEAGGHEIDPELRLARARAYHTLGDYTGVERELGTLDANRLASADRGQVAMLRAERYVLTDFPRAETLYREAEGLGVSAADREYLRGLRAGRTPDALAAFRAAIRLDPRHLSARLLAALTAFLLGELTEAETVLEQSRLLAPDHPAVAILAGVVGTFLGRTGAEEALDRATAEYRGPLSLMVTIARAFREYQTLQVAPDFGAKRDRMQALVERLLAETLVNAADAPFAALTDDRTPPFLRPAWRVLLTHQFPIDLNALWGDGRQAPAPAMLQQVLQNPGRKWNRQSLAAFRRDLDNHPEGTAFYFYGLAMDNWVRGQARGDAAPDRAEQERTHREMGEVLATAAETSMTIDLRAQCLDLAAISGWKAAEASDDPVEKERLQKRGAALAVERYRRFGLPGIDRVEALHMVAREGKEYAVARTYLEHLEHLDPNRPRLAFRRAQLAELTGNPLVARREASLVLTKGKPTYSPAFLQAAEEIFQRTNQELMPFGVREMAPPPRKDE